MSVALGITERVFKMEKDVIKTAVLGAIKHRRSTRSFLQDPVPEEALTEIVEAGRHAPSANNKQNTSFYVITNPEKRTELRAAVTAALAGTEPQEGMSPTFLQLINRAREGEVDVTYGAPALIVTTNKMDNVNAIADCSCALQNMMLAASVSGIANVWINQFFSLREAPLLREFFASLGVPEDETLCGALALGHSEKIDTDPLPRTGFHAIFIR